MDGGVFVLEVDEELTKVELKHSITSQSTLKSVIIEENRIVSVRRNAKTGKLFVGIYVRRFHDDDNDVGMDQMVTFKKGEESLFEITGSTSDIREISAHGKTIMLRDPPRVVNLNFLKMTADPLDSPLNNNNNNNDYKNRINITLALKQDLKRYIVLQTNSASLIEKDSNFVSNVFKIPNKKFTHMAPAPGIIYFVTSNSNVLGENPTFSAIVFNKKPIKSEINNAETLLCGSKSISHPKKSTSQNSPSLDSPSLSSPSLNSPPLNEDKEKCLLF